MGNIVIENDWSEVKLIDWGCGSQIKNNLSPKAGSRTVRSPEMLLGYSGYGSKGDIWSIGVLILYILTKGKLPWKAKTAHSALTLMSAFIGSETLLDLATKYECELPEDVIKEIRETKPLTYKDAFSRKMKHLRDPQLLDLMYQLLTVDVELRPSAEEALQHTFFR